MDSRTLKLQCKGWYISQNVNILSNVNVSGTPKKSAFFYSFWAEYY